MSVLNLYRVTDTLARLLAFNVRLLMPQGGIPSDVDVTTTRPELVTGEQPRLNLHLYHAAETHYHAKVPGLGAGTPTFTPQPLALALSYVVTAHHDVDGSPSAREEQLLLGLAMKTLHDYPMIDDSLTIPATDGTPQAVMPDDLVGGDNRFDITLQPVAAEDAVAFWAAEQKSTVQLAAYYEVRTVVFDAEAGPDG